jgi:hypothetical protein
MIWVAGRSPTLVSHSLRGVATNLKATTLAYLAILQFTSVYLSMQIFTHHFIQLQVRLEKLP